MKREIEISLLDEVVQLRTQNRFNLDANVATNAYANYRSAERFGAECERIFARLPNALAHTSELPEAGSFVRRRLAGLPILLTRDEAGDVHAFLNICRHRGTRLVDAQAGCSRRFVCPYHAWTYDTRGQFTGAPHFEAGFADLDRAQLGLRRLWCEERFGLIWVQAEGDGPEPGAWFGELSPELEALGMADLQVVGSDERTYAANWKLLAEGGIESYHFRVVHRATIGPHFEDNLSTYQTFGPHLRSVLPRSNIARLAEMDRDTWRIREHANVLYTVFPNSQFLVMPDHVAWIVADPLDAGSTQLRIVTLAPQGDADAAGKDAAYWQRNHQITLTTLAEDFEIAESIQSSVDSGVDDLMRFGRFEGALGYYNRAIGDYLG